jgi:hypothetical protein
MYEPQISLSSIIPSLMLENNFHTNTKQHAKIIVFMHIKLPQITTYFHHNMEYSNFLPKPNSTLPELFKAWYSLSKSRTSVPHQLEMLLCYKNVFYSILKICWYSYTSKKFIHTRLIRFEVFTAVTMKNGVFWVVTPCGSCKNRRFGGTWRLTWYFFAAYVGC